jgi:hypothetical protein
VGRRFGDFGFWEKQRISPEEIPPPVGRRMGGFRRPVGGGKGEFIHGTCGAADALRALGSSILKSRPSARLRRAGCLFLNLGSLRHD